jgi:hypothetical protein
MHDYVVRVRPKTSLSRTGATTFFALTIPIFAVLYWYNAPVNKWQWVLSLQVVLFGLFIGILIRQSRVFTGVTEHALIGNGIFSPSKQVELANLCSVVLARVYHRDSAETSIQFLANDGSGIAQFRMRGEFWHEDDLRAVVAALGVVNVIENGPFSREEFFARHPGSRYWFERKR